MTEKCKVHLEALKKPACMATVSGIAWCESCGGAMCPKCGRHHVIQLSRVTGYIGSVSGFNEGKKQELRDRKRHDFGKKQTMG